MSKDVNVAELSPEAKLDFLRDQILAVNRGDASSLFCPYCGTRNTPSAEFLCCALFHEATQAILTRMEQQEGIDAIEQIQTAHDNAYWRVN